MLEGHFLVQITDTVLCRLPIKKWSKINFLTDIIILLFNTSLALVKMVSFTQWKILLTCRSLGNEYRIEKIADRLRTVISRLYKAIDNNRVNTV